jgi:hypothetical protein
MEDQSVFVEQLNWPPIEVGFSINAKQNYPVDDLTTKMITIFKPSGYETQISVIPYIEIDATKDRIMGFGIQKTPVHISIHGPSDGLSMSIGLSADKGYLEEDQIILEQGTTATVYLRSENIGESRLSVHADIPSLGDVVIFVFPWTFLLFSIIGAVIGSLIRIFRIKKKPFDTRSFIVGVLLGFTVSVSYWALGLDLLNIDLDIGYINEFAILALSILGGLLGGYIGRTKG